MTTNSPATPLPWGALEHQHIRPMEDAGYIFHACNAYPQLVEALRGFTFAADNSAQMPKDIAEVNLANARALLRSLGEKV